MAYLIYPEFKRFIQTENLNQVINNDSTILNDAILDAQDIAKENLVQRYLIDDELASLNIYDPLTTYVPGDRIYLDANPYDGALTYALGVLVSKDKNVYKCSVAIVSPEVFNVAHWTLVGVQYAMFYIPYPHPLFDVNKVYAIGNIVFRLGKNYTARIASLAFDHTTLLQDGVYANVPLQNVFPEDPINGVQYWGIGTAVTVSGATFPTGFTAGDNRSRNLVRHLIAIVLYIIHDRIAPRNIPAVRDLRYKEAIRWLVDARDGHITADIAVIQPRTGGRLRWGSAIKNINGY